MSKIALGLTVFGALVFSSLTGVALADQGGIPNDNAFSGGPGTDSNGRKVVCVPPGFFFKSTAQLAGPNNDPFGNGLTPGQEVVAQCDPGNPS